MRFLPLMILGVLVRVVSAADPALEPAPDEASPLGLEFQTGVVELPNKVAHLELEEGYRYLSPADARTVLEEMWGNPPGTANGLLGMVVPLDEDLEKGGAWVATLAYAEEGHLSDEVMAGFNAGAYLEYLKDLNKLENEKRKAQGQPVMELVDWASLPFYSARTKVFTGSKRFWNEQAKRGQETTIEHERWVLGRRGRFIVRAIAPRNRRNEGSYFNVTHIAEMIRFNPGHRHEDFNPKSDPLAKLPTAMLAKEAAAESKSFFSSLARRKLPLLVLIVVAVFVKKVIDKFREA